MVWGKPRTELAKELGVSNVAIGKRCRTRGIDQPPGVTGRKGKWRLHTVLTRVQCVNSALHHLNALEPLRDSTHTLTDLRGF